MLRHCSCCKKTLTARELGKDESRVLEAERKAMGLEGVLFRYYECSLCGKADIFVDVYPFQDETDEEFQARRNELATTLGGMHHKNADVILVERYAGFSVWS